MFWRYGMTHRDFAKNAPMGWNSWDCFGAAVNEKQLKENADYMAKNLKKYGWEYIVCDIQWYEPKAKDNDYNNFTELDMDEYGRLIPPKTVFRALRAVRALSLLPTMFTPSA